MNLPSVEKAQTRFQLPNHTSPSTTTNNSLAITTAMEKRNSGIALHVNENNGNAS